MMRLVERTLRSVQIAPRSVQTDSLGGVIEQFSDNRISVRCVAVPGGNTLNYAANSLNPMEHGVFLRQNLKLLMPRNTSVSAGDGICMDGEAQPGWRCVAVEKWSGHLAVKIERLP